MDKAELVATVAARTRMSAADVALVIDTLVDVIVRERGGRTSGAMGGVGGDVRIRVEVETGGEVRGVEIGQRSSRPRWPGQELPGRSLPGSSGPSSPGPGVGGYGGDSRTDPAVGGFPGDPSSGGGRDDP